MFNNKRIKDLEEKVSKLETELYTLKNHLIIQPSYTDSRVVTCYFDNHNPNLVLANFDEESFTTTYTSQPSIPDVSTKCYIDELLKGLINKLGYKITFTDKQPAIFKLEKVKPEKKKKVKKKNRKEVIK